MPGPVPLPAGAVAPAAAQTPTPMPTAATEPTAAPVSAAIDAAAPKPKPPSMPDRFVFVDKRSLGMFTGQIVTDLRWPGPAGGRAESDIRYQLLLDLGWFGKKRLTDNGNVTERHGVKTARALDLLRENSAKLGVDTLIVDKKTWDPIGKYSWRRTGEKKLQTWPRNEVPPALRDLIRSADIAQRALLPGIIFPGYTQ